PYPETHNLSGRVGALIAYHLLAAIGQVVFPVLSFASICLTLVLLRNPVSDLWLRVIGMIVLTIAFAAAINSFKPGSPNRLPEGQGGIVGIGVQSLLQPHFSVVGTRLILVMGILVGLLLAADDLVLRTPALVGSAMNNLKSRTPKINWNFITVPRLPSLPRF